MTPATSCKSEETLTSCDLAYADEPMADEDLLKAYGKELKENEKVERMMLEEIAATGLSGIFWTNFSRGNRFPS